MSAHLTQRFTLTIANGGTDSEYLSSKFSAGQLKTLLGSLVQMVIHTPAALTGTVTLQVRAQEGTGTPVTLQSPPGTDIALPAAKAVPINVAGFRDLRIHSSGAEGAERVFEVICQVTVTR